MILFFLKALVGISPAFWYCNKKATSEGALLPLALAALASQNKKVMIRTWRKGILSGSAEIE
jgi:hypothetical protein